MVTLSENVGKLTLDALADVGRGFSLLRDVGRQVPYAWRMRREVFEQMHVVAIGSLPLALVVAIFVGAVTAVQGVYQMQAYVPMAFLGVVVSKTVFIELGPVVTALVVGGRLCANYAAELGTMKVTEQLDAMEMLAVDPVRYLALPRFLAAILMLPVIVVFADAIAVISAYFVSVATLDVTSSTFTEGMILLFKQDDLVGGLIKTFFFGGLIAHAGVYYGFNTQGGAEGVGAATMKAVVASCVSILIADYLLATVLFQVIFGGS